MKRKNILTGSLLLAASIGFFVSWFLMPDPGTTDTIHILNIVKRARAEVMISVITQVSASVLYIIALFSLTQLNFPLKRIALIGISLLGIGVLGLCSDGFFHLLAWFMTEDSVNIQQDVVSVMDAMQTTGVAFLIPILLPFFIGSLLLAIGLNKQGVISRSSKLIMTGAFSIGILGILASKSHICEQAPMLVILGIFSIGQACAGFELIKTSGKMQATPATH